MTSPEAHVESPFLEGNFGPVSEEVAAEKLHVIGELPPEMAGAFIRNGPNPQFSPIRGYHWFGGDGMLHGVHIRQGKASYRNRWVRTDAFLRERAAGRALWPSDLGPPDFDNPNGPTRGNTGNTALVWHDGRLLALWEGGEPHHINAPDLETVGPYTYGGQLNHAFTAHPKVDAVTGEMIFFGYCLYAEPFLQYSVVSKEGRIVHTTPIELPIGVMMHDFAVTERYSIFMDLPFTFSMEKAGRGEMPFAWEPERGARFGVLPRHGGASDIRWFSGPACFVFHTLNAFEEGDEVILDACRMPQLDLFNLKTDLIDGESVARMHRWRFNMRTGEMKEQPLDDARSDFPRINDQLIGRSARYGYAARFERSSFTSDALIKYDLATGRSVHHEHGQGRSGGEGVFVPRHNASAEDDGWVMTCVYDEATGKSELVILNAQDFGGPPAARVLLPRRVPHGFHGAWVSSEQLAAQRA